MLLTLPIARLHRTTLALVLLLAALKAPVSAAETVPGPAALAPAAIADSRPAQAAASPAQGAPAQASALQGKDAPLPPQYGLALEYGYTFDPTPRMNLLMARFSAIYDYGTIWHTNKAPNTLRFKVEASAGTTLNPGNNFIASANMLAMKYPFGLDRELRPYIEGGIGVIYTEYRVHRQGLHFNFNPVLGTGIEVPQPDGRNYFTAVRLYHLSNAELYHENRGVNWVALQIGRFF